MASVARAAYNVWVSWSAYNLGLFTFDSSTFDGADRLGVSPFDTRFLGTYDDLSSKLDLATVTRGRSNNLDTMLAGGAQFTARDPAGLFNADNAASPLFGLIEDRLHPVKITATYLGVTYGLFYGWVRRVVWNPSKRRATADFECVDLFYWLARANPVIASTGATTTGAAIGKILDAVGALDPAMRSLSVGDIIPDFSADGSKSGLQLIQDLLEAERGVFYIAGTGRATYVSRYDRLTRTSLATIADRMTSLAPGVDFDQAFTRATVTRTQTGYKATATSAVAAAKFGYNDLPPIETAYLNDDAGADNLASWILAQNVSAKPPMYDFQLDNRDSDLLVQVLARELVDKITVSESFGGSAGLFHVDSMSHSIDRQSGRHSVAWLLSEALPFTPLVFDAATAQFDTAEFGF